MNLRLLILGAAMALSGCANFAPRYTRPEAAVPVAGQPAAQDAAQDAATVPWRDFVNDARLRQTIAVGLANNRDLRVAALNVQRARAQYRVQDAVSLPQLNASAGLSRSGAGNNIGNSATINLGLSAFELDLFGRVKNLSESALQATFASAETRRSVQINLVAELAKAWLNLAADQALQRLAQQTLDSRQRSQDLNTRRHELGGITGLALSQTQSALASARLDVANAAAQVEQDRHALELLAGAAVPAELLPGDSLAAPTALVDLPEGVSSSVLQRRPDVLAAEHQLQAAHADIGAARAAMFPRIALTAAAGSSSDALSGLFKAGSRAWNFGPSISLPLFDGGASQATLDASRIGREIAWAQYDRAVQVAFREVADALSVRASLAQRLAAQASLNVATERQLRLAEALFRAGGSTQLDVLDAQRSFYAAQQGQIALRLAEQTNRITLYKVLGGGSLEQE